MFTDCCHYLLILSIYLGFNLTKVGLFCWDGSPGSASKTGLSPAFQLYNILFTMCFFSAIGCFMCSNFSLSNVFTNSNVNTPLLFQISATWSNHEGSLLLWCWLLTFFGRSLDKSMVLYERENLSPCSPSTANTLAERSVGGALFSPGATRPLVSPVLTHRSFFWGVESGLSFTTFRFNVSYMPILAVARQHVLSGTSIAPFYSDPKTYSGLSYRLGAPRGCVSTKTDRERLTSESIPVGSASPQERPSETGRPQYDSRPLNLHLVKIDNTPTLISAEKSRRQESTANSYSAAVLQPLNTDTTQGYLLTSPSSLLIYLFIVFFFALFLLTTSNPFLKNPFLSINSIAELNPVLQDPVLAIHPPCIYTGYVASAVGFSLCLSRSFYVINFLYHFFCQRGLVNVGLLQRGCRGWFLGSSRVCRGRIWGRRPSTYLYWRYAPYVRRSSLQEVVLGSEKAFRDPVGACLALQEVLGTKGAFRALKKRSFFFSKIPCTNPPYFYDDKLLYNDIWLHLRFWICICWCFLTIGILLGSWWAYHELGWGGWWFWDPVENASLMPWLFATACIHSVLIPRLNYWTLFFNLFTFVLSVLGTFFVRSGLLASVHSFATDSTRGFVLLGFLVCIGGLAPLQFVASRLFKTEPIHCARGLRGCLLFLRKLLKREAGYVILAVSSATFCRKTMGHLFSRLASPVRGIATFLGIVSSIKSQSKIYRSTGCVRSTLSLCGDRGTGGRASKAQRRIGGDKGRRRVLRWRSPPIKQFACAEKEKGGTRGRYFAGLALPILKVACASHPVSGAPYRSLVLRTLFPGSLPLRSLVLRIKQSAPKRERLFSFVALGNKQKKKIEQLLELQNAFFFILTGIVLCGTAAPILFQIFSDRDVSTGAAFFNSTIVPLVCCILLMLIFLHSWVDVGDRRTLVRTSAGQATLGAPVDVGDRRTLVRTSAGQATLGAPVDVGDRRTLVRTSAGQATLGAPVDVGDRRTLVRTSVGQATAPQYRERRSRSQGASVALPRRSLVLRTKRPPQYRERKTALRTPKDKCGTSALPILKVACPLDPFKGQATDRERRLTGNQRTPKDKCGKARRRYCGVACSSKGGDPFARASDPQGAPMLRFSKLRNKDKEPMRVASAAPFVLVSAKKAVGHYWLPCCAIFLHFCLFHFVGEFSVLESTYCVLCFMLLFILCLSTGAPYRSLVRPSGLSAIGAPAYTPYKCEMKGAKYKHKRPCGQLSLALLGQALPAGRLVRSTSDRLGSATEAPFISPYNRELQTALRTAKDNCPHGRFFGSPALPAIGAPPYNREMKGAKRQATGALYYMAVFALQKGPKDKRPPGSADAPHLSFGVLKAVLRSLLYGGRLSVRTRGLASAGLALLKDLARRRRPPGRGDVSPRVRSTSDLYNRSATLRTRGLASFAGLALLKSLVLRTRGLTSPLPGGRLRLAKSRLGSATLRTKRLLGAPPKHPDASLPALSILWRSLVLTDPRGWVSLCPALPSGSIWVSLQKGREDINSSASPSLYIGRLFFCAFSKYRRLTSWSIKEGLYKGALTNRYVSAFWRSTYVDRHQTGTEDSPRARLLAAKVADTLATKANVHKLFLQHLNSTQPLSQSRINMKIAHMGFLLFITGVLLSNRKKRQSCLQMHSGFELRLDDKICCLRSIDQNVGPTFRSICGNVIIYQQPSAASLLVLDTKFDKDLPPSELKQLKKAFVMFPETRFSFSNKELSTTKVAIHTNLLSDIYMLIGTGSSDSGWFVTTMQLPYIFCIWLGFLLAAIAGFHSVSLLLKQQRLNWL